MRLKLRFYRRADQPAVDLLVEYQGSATVGELAGFFAEADPSGDAPGGPVTLALGATSSRYINPETPLEASGIGSGASVALASARGGGHQPLPATPSSSVATLKVVSGPDIGKSVKLRPGISTVGRDSSCDIILADTLVSRQHAKVIVSDLVEVIDNGSANGTLSGGVAVDRMVVHPGDLVTVGDTSFTITLTRMRDSETSSGTVLFNRPPVLLPHLDGITLEAPTPPDPAPRSRFPVLSLLMPLVLGVVLYVATKSIMDLLFIGLSPLMLVGNLVEGQFTGRKTSRQAAEVFQREVKKFEEQASHLIETERANREARYPQVQRCMDAATHRTPLLWPRTRTHPDFLAFRVGAGVQQSLLKVKLPTRAKGNAEYWDELVSRSSAFESVADVPMTCSLSTDGHLGIGGARTETLALARSLIVQAAVLHPPDALTIAACVAQSNRKEWGWLKWLPQVASSNSHLLVNSLCANQSSCDALIEDLERLVKEREGDGTAKGAVDSAGADQEAILVLIADSAPVNRPRLVAMSEGCAEVGIYFLWLAESVDELPSTCSLYVNVESGQEHGRIGFVKDGSEVEVSIEGITSEEAQQCSLRLSPIVDAGASVADTAGLPRSVSFLRLAGLEIAEDPEMVIERWTESRSILRGPRAIAEQDRRPGTLRALLGSSTAGPYVLDLRTNGPHALVGGTTGAGKSELLQSWILGMAVAHSPQRVTFLLVDYKGGSAFRECVNLPHTVGLVTDLNPYLVRRALVSFGAELRYREDLLHRRNAKDLIELERNGDPEAPPSLVIVVDEFAALVQEVPEFVDGMVNIAQRGRSLGLHLILATQRPAGVIKDNLRANTNLRLALRMADVADSSDVLGIPDAAFFDPDIPGRAGVCSGPSRLHVFQAAYSGGFTSRTPDPPTFKVESLDFDGGSVWERPVGHALEPARRGPSDIQRVVGTILKASASSSIGLPRKPWLSPLASTYKLEDLTTERRDDKIVFAVADLPEEQSQVTMAFNPDRDGNLGVIGTGGSGKSTLLRTIAIASGMTLRGGPVQIYALDFGARGLQMLEDLPNVGSVIQGSDVERVGRLLDWIRSLIDERAARYSTANAGTIVDYRTIAGAAEEPRIFLLIDGVSAFRSTFESTNVRLIDLLTSIAGDGRPVGVHTILSADRLNAFPMSLASHIQRRVVLRLADTADYAALSVPDDIVTASSVPGRGILDDHEIQIATLGGTGDVMAQAQELREYAKALRAGGVREAPPIQRLPELLLRSELPATFEDLPVVGMLGSTLAPATFDPKGIFILTGPRGSGRSMALSIFVSSLHAWKPDVALYYIGDKRSELAKAEFWTRSGVDEEEVKAVIEDLNSVEATGFEAALVLEATEQFVNSPLDAPLRACISRLLNSDQFILAEGDISGITQMRELTMLLRSSRTGLVLMPDPNTNLSGLFGADFPRFKRGDFFEGRGYLVRRGRKPDVVQVAYEV